MEVSEGSLEQRSEQLAEKIFSAAPGATSSGSGGSASKFS